VQQGPITCLVRQGNMTLRLLVLTHVQGIDKVTT